MFLQLIVSSVIINFVSSSEHQYLSKYGNENRAIMDGEAKTNTERIKSTTGDNFWHQHFWKPHKGTPYNLTYIEKAENLIRLPALSKYYQETKGKKKSLKKSPRRTIQKIIKKNSKLKIKKMYVVKMTSRHTTVIPKLESDKDQEEYSSRKAEMTTRSNQKKKLRKYNVKQAKLPQYRQMQTRKNNYKRDKRYARDNNILILKDFDSMQFLKEKKDYNVVNAHFKNHW